MPGTRSQTPTQAVRSVAKQQETRKGEGVVVGVGGGGMDGVVGGVEGESV